MAFFYVKSSFGTRTSGGGTTQQSGTFTALGAGGVYGSIVAAITDGAGAGDVICCSDSHAYSNTVTITISGPAYAATPPSPLQIISVSDAACQTYSAGASESTTTSNPDIIFDGVISMYGMTFDSSDQLYFGSALRAYECTFSSVDVKRTPGDGNVVFLVDCVIDVSSEIRIDGGTLFSCTGGSFTGTHTALFGTTGGNGGALIRINNADISAMSSLTYLLNSVGDDQLADDGFDIRFNNCTLPTGLTGFSNNDFTNASMDFYVTGCVSSANASAYEYQYYYQGGTGSLTEETTKYRDNSTAFPGSQKISIKCVTTARAENSLPFSFAFPAKFAALSSTASDVVTLYFMSATSLDNGDIWAEISYADGTNKYVSNTITSATDAFLTADFRTPGALDTNTETWTGRTTENRYEISFDTSSDAGADQITSIQVYVAAPSTTIYFCPTLGLS